LILAKNKKQKHNQKQNHQKNNSTGRVTRKTKKEQEKRNQNLHFPQFFFLVYLVGVFFFLFFSLILVF